MGLILVLYSRSPCYGAFSHAGLSNGGSGIGHRAIIKNFSCPADPTYGNGLGEGDWASGSYVANYQVFGNPGVGNNASANAVGYSNLKASFSDGTSQTILFAEQYAQRPGGHWTLWAHGGWNDSWAPIFAYGSADGTQAYNSGMDTGAGMVGPNSKFTFVNPSAYTQGPTSEILRPHGLHTTTMTAGMADGSVRTLNSGMDPNTWWAICTPAQGDIPGDY